MGKLVRNVIIFGVIQECFLAGILILGNLRDAIPLFLLFYFAAFLAFLGAARFSFQAPCQDNNNPLLLPIIIVFALLFRVTLLCTEPTLSEDIYRYLWDGRLVNEGINPYQYVPGSSDLSDLRDSRYKMINHKDIGTPYGPLSIMIYSISQRIMDSVYFMKLLFVLFDCLTVILIMRMLELSGAPKSNVIIYAWNPLVLIEVAGSGHNDSLGVFLLLASLYLIQRGRYLGASIGFAAALLAKYFALIFLPVLLKEFRKGEWILIPLVLLAGFFPFAEYLESHAMNIMEVGSAWRFNDSLFSLLLYFTGSLYYAKVIVIIAMLMLAVIVWRSALTPLRGAMIMIGGALLFTTTAQPWYFLWLVPFLCFYHNRAWLMLTALVMISYHVLIRYEAEGIWDENLWIKLVIYVPFYILLLSDSLRSLRIRGAD